MISQCLTEYHKVTSALQRAKQHYYNAILKHVTTINAVRKQLNNLLGHTPQPELLNEMNVNGMLVSSTSLANMLNEFFLKI